MKSINPKCTNKNSFKYTILISLHYYDLNRHKERTNKHSHSQLNKYSYSRLNKYSHKYNFKSVNEMNKYITFENNNNISLTVYDENKQIIYQPKNN